jgi:hypothetical protein
MFHVGDKVISKKYGIGIIESINCAFNPRPITVKFNNSDVRQTYTIEGYYVSDIEDLERKFYTSNIKPLKLYTN